jgi:streptogramin lyase
MRVLRLSVVVGVVGALLAAAPAGAFVVEPVSGPSSGSNGIVLGPDGNFWVAEEFSGEVVRMTPSGTVLNRFAVGIRPTGITMGPNGTVWVSVTGISESGFSLPQSARLVWFDAAAPDLGGTDVLLNIPAGNCGPRGIVAGPDGRIYFAIPADVYFPDGLGQFTTPCPGGGRLGSVAASGGPAVLSGPDPVNIGNVFDLAIAGGELFAPDNDGNIVHRFPLGGSFVPDSSVTTSAGSHPYGVTADSGANIWVTEQTPGGVARFPASQTNGSATEFVAPAGALRNPTAIVAGTDGRMYVAGNEGFNLARVSADGSFAFYPTLNAKPKDIINGTDGDLWFTDNNNSAIGRFVNSQPRVTAGAAAATGPTSGAATASVNPRGNDTQVVFDYGPTTAYGSTSAPVAVPAGTAPVALTGVLAGQRPATTYHVRARAANAEGSATAGAETTFTTPLGDADGDGVAAPADCRDDNPLIHPGAVDKPGDKIDQDCSGEDAAFPLLSALTTFAYSPRARDHSALLLKIEIARLHGGEIATIRCTGRHCPFRVKTYRKLKTGKRVFGRKLLRNRRLTAGSRLSVFVTKKSSIGTTAVLSVSRTKAAKVTRACVKPGAKKPSRCP